MVENWSRLRMLVPVDGSSSSDSAVRWAIAIRAACGAEEVRLLHVEVPEFLQVDDGGEVESARLPDPAASAREILETADVPYVAETRRGFVPQEIASCSKENRCSVVIMGTRGLGKSADIPGSIARQVVSLIDVPVTLVK